MEHAVECSQGECFFDPLLNTIKWDVFLEPGTDALLSYPVFVKEISECEPPYEITNEVWVTDDQETVSKAESTIVVECSAPT